MYLAFVNKLFLFIICWKIVKTTTLTITDFNESPIITLTVENADSVMFTLVTLLFFYLTIYIRGDNMPIF